MLASLRRRDGKSSANRPYENRTTPFLRKCAGKEFTRWLLSHREMSLRIQDDLPRRAPLSLRLLSEADSAALADLAAEHSLRLLTPRLNLEVYGFDGPILRAWGIFSNDSLAGILIRFRNTVIAVDGN